MIQILFNPERTLRLRILSTQGIGRAWVEGHSVELQDVGHGARMCLDAESRALSDLGEGRYRLRNGPYMRRFLDGYHPMRVVLQVQYPLDALRFEAAWPGPQPGLEVHQGPGEVRVDATFEGRLYTCMNFLALGGVAAPGPSPPCSGEPIKNSEQPSRGSLRGPSAGLRALWFGQTGARPSAHPQG